MYCFQMLILVVFLNIFQCVTVYSGSFTGSQLTQHIKYYEAINYNIEDIAQQHHRATRSIGNQEKNVEIKFYSHDRHFHIRLRRDTSILMQDFALVTSQGELPYFVNNLYAGEVVDEPGSYCHGTITNGTLNGRIYSKGDAYTLEPAKLYFDSADFHSVMYSDKHVDKSSLMGSGCGVMGDILKRMQEKVKKEPDQDKESEQESNQGNSRQRRQSNNQKIDKQTCPLYIQTDHVFYKRFGSRDAVVSYVLNHVKAADYIYKSTTFDRFRNINFAISRLRVWSPDDKRDPNYKFASDYIGVEKYLDLASEGDWTDYCASYTFTNRDFSNGVLGLAWIASSATNSDGGVCSAYDRSVSGSTLNTGIVTLNNYGSYVPPAVSHLTFAHELGHTFGSFHDPDTTECTPGGDQGNYLMFAHASAADKPNNGVVSVCSNSDITEVLNSLFNDRSKPWCLVEKSSITVCGNGIVEEDEECDCGFEDICDDKCCHAQNDNSDNTLACKLKGNTPNYCSPSQGACCNPDTCLPHNNTVECFKEEDCQAQSLCTGNSVDCPTPAIINEGETCNDGRLRCENGNCSLSICSYGNNLEPCQCSGEKAALCQVCCQPPNQPQSCVPSYRLNIPPGENDPTFIATGSPCNNYMGYCDVFNECRLANEDGPLTSIIRRIFFSDEPEILDALRSWLTDNWWVVLIAAIILIIVMVAIVLICDRLIPTSNPFRMEKEKFKNRRSSTYVKFRGRQDRNTQYGRRNQPPPNMDDHPDSRTESRATSF
ncbi:LOW QUALITY PROTEIN: disintegrin and metalloproteinase domain-containing protein 10-like [Amphiura filiformis]|uniref:LOW QUALITY PROTEIN: disintegrin and metalloproteinase domain-containing protein 10-like n=1 Tax=Amphiura filiformis TaxID=82378 RepID=UPI003B228BE8